MEDVVTEKNHKECGGTPWQNSGECFAFSAAKKEKTKKKEKTWRISTYRYGCKGI